MSTAALPPSAATRADVIVTLLREGSALVDRLMGVVSDDTLPVGNARAALTELSVVTRRLDSLRLRLTSAAAEERAPERSGHTSTGSWLARATQTDGRRAAGEAALAEALGNAPAPASAEMPAALRLVGTDLAGPGGPDVGRESGPGLGSAASPGESSRSVTGQALDAGRISVEHAQIIVRTLADLPDWVDPEQRRGCEVTLVDWSLNRAPARLRVIARRVLATVTPPEQIDRVDVHENDVIAAEEEAALEHVSFWMRDNHNGTSTGQFTVPTLAAAALSKVLDAMTAPRRRKVPTSVGAAAVGATAAAGGAGASWKQGQVEWQQRRGIALAELLEHLPTDHLHERTAATVIVTTRLDDLKNALVRAGRLDTGAKISAGEARRTACGAGLIPSVLGGSSVPIDLGRAARLFTSTQKTALASLYDECASEGCDRPVAWTETHHLKAWSHGGTTDLANAVPLCWAHHRRLHQNHPHTVQRRPDRTWSIEFHRRD